MEFIKHFIADNTEEITDEKKDKVTNEPLIKPQITFAIRSSLQCNRFNYSGVGLKLCFSTHHCKKGLFVLPVTLGEHPRFKD